MRTKTIFSCITSALVFGLVISSAKAEDVFVDLSALDTLQPAEAPASDFYAQPAPVLPPVASSSIPARVDVPLDPQTNAPMVIRHEPLFPVYVKPKVEPKKVVKKEPVKVVEPEVIEQEIVEPEEVSAPAPAEVAAEAVKSPVETPVAEEPAVEETPASSVPVSDQTPPLPQTEPNPFEATEPAVESAPREVMLEEVEVKEEATVIEPLVPVEVEPTAAESIRFEDDSTTLSDLNKAKIDSMVTAFKDTPSHKISILSYNYDDGQDTFKKKRQSLDRAVEVRSYLLSKGYKNFNNIKVININDDISKKNVVEIEETH